jgi:DNA-binding MarR family transcriptional regulator
MTHKSKTNATQTEAPPAASNVPPPLRNTPNWIVWKEEKRDGDLTKVPYHPSREHKTDATDPENGTTFQEAYSTLSAGDYDGLAFIFTGTDYAGIDLDGCRSPNTGEVSKKAREIIERFDSYTEVSPSEDGFHILIFGSKPGDRCKYKDLNGVKEVEIYDTNRFFTVTGDSLQNTPGYISKAQEELNALYREFFGEPDQSSSDGYSTATDTDTEKISGQYPNLDLDDETVLNKLRSAKNSELFHRLFNGGVTTLHGPKGSQSEADAALVGLLIFYTGDDREQIDRLFRRSALCREKWTTRPDYRKRTIRKALEGRDESDFYSGTADKRSTGEKISELLKLFPSIKWPNQRTNEYDKDTFQAILEVAEQACSLTVSPSLRRLSDLTGIPYQTVRNVLDRLESYGFIERVEEPQGRKPATYEITPDRALQFNGHASGTRFNCHVLSGVSMEELNDTAYYPGALGRKARSIVNVLRDTGGVDSMGELADLADTTKRTVRRKLKTLTTEGIVQTKHEPGEGKQVWLHDCWEERLNEYRKDAPTWLEDVERMIKNKEDQIMNEHEENKREEGKLKLVRIGGRKVELPGDVIRYLKLERKYRERLNNTDKPGLNSDVLDELAELQSGFNDRVKRLANDLLDLIRERIEKQREKWGLNND